MLFSQRAWLYQNNPSFRFPLRSVFTELCAHGPLVMPQFSTFSESLKLVVAVFGAWTLYAQVMIFLRYDFSTLVSYSLLPLVFAPLILLVMAKRAVSPPVIERSLVAKKPAPLARLPSWFWFLCPFLIAGIHVLTDSDWVFWVLACAFLLAASIAFRALPMSHEPNERAIAPWEWLVLTGICSIAVLVTTGTLRADPDDAFFVSLASSALDHPTVALYGFDNLYRDGLPLLEQARHLMQTYEYFVAMLSGVTGISIHTLYYVVMPIFWTLVSIPVQWLLLRRFLPPGPALIGLAALIAFLMLSGDEHRTYGNFGFVRFYQGKAIYLLVALPMIVSSALSYSSNPNWRNWTILMLVQCAGAGFSLTALFVGPLAAGTALLAGMHWSPRSLRTTAAGMAASLIVLLAAVGMKLYLTDYTELAELSPEALRSLPSIAKEAVHPSVNKFYDVPLTLVLGYKTVLGLDRSNMVLLGLLLLPFLASRAKLRGLPWICNYLFICTAVLLCPAVSELLGRHITDVLSWRIFWSWPVPLLLALGIGAVACTTQLKPWLRLAVICGVLLLFSLAGPLAVSRDNWAWENIGRYKVFPSHNAAEYLISRIDLTRPALVPEELAISLGGLRQAPPLVALRNYYLRSLPGFIPKADLLARRALLSYIDGRIAHIKMSWVIEEIEQRDIATVAFKVDHKKAEILSKALRAQGFKTEQRFEYVLATKALHERPAL
jgi:hypothetical protein